MAQRRDPEAKSDPLPIPVIAMQDCGAVLGRRGAGKSGTGRKMLEHELDAGHRCGVIDPKGDWYGIRANKDGSPSRFPVIVFGGAHADVPIDDKMGGALGTVLAGSSSSFILDLSGFSVAGMRRFMSAFAEHFFLANRQPITLFVDEADQLAPQRVPAEAAKLLHHMESLIRQGRQRGIFMWMLTQRPAVLNKNLLSQAETLIAMQMTGPHDRKAIREWMDAHDPVAAANVETQLAKLKTGEAYVWVPGANFLERVQFPLFETYDSGRTPKHGEAVGNVQLKPLDVGEIKSLLQQDDDVRDELAELRAALADLKSAYADERLAHRETRRERDAISARENKLLAILIALQLRIGAAIGSSPIEPLALSEPYDRYLMAEGPDGVIRAIPRTGDNPQLPAAAKRRVRRANQPQKG
jgi:hypothetical protein